MKGRPVGRGREGVTSKRTVNNEDADLVEELGREFAAVRARSGEWLACEPGCSECCHRLFPITRLDARRLRRAFEELEAADPPRARRIAARVRRVTERLSEDFPGMDDERALDRFFSRHEGLRCPVLDPGTGCCELYDARPVACRIYGPPLRFGDRDSPPCRLCFEGAAADVVERCRWEPDPGGKEQRILQRIGVPPGRDWETLIAFALSR